MLRNYFKIAWRNLWKTKGNFLLNVLGLATGLTCFAFISLWVNDELSYDKFHSNYERIARVTGVRVTDTKMSVSPRLGAPVVKALVDFQLFSDKIVQLYKNTGASAPVRAVLTITSSSR